MGNCAEKSNQGITSPQQHNPEINLIFQKEQKKTPMDKIQLTDDINDMKHKTDKQVDNFMKNIKSSTTQMFRQFEPLIKQKFHSKIKNLQSYQLQATINHYWNLLKKQSVSNNNQQKNLINLQNINFENIQKRFYKIYEQNLNKINQQLIQSINSQIQPIKDQISQYENYVNTNSKTQNYKSTTNEQIVQQHLDEKDQLIYTQSDHKVLRTILKNIYLDYPKQYTKQNLINVMEIYRKCHSQKDKNMMDIIYNTQIMKLQSDKKQFKNQLEILDWFRTQRGSKYDNNNVVGTQNQPNVQVPSALPICTFTKDLIKADITKTFGQNFKFVLRFTISSILMLLKTQIVIYMNNKPIKRIYSLKLQNQKFRLIFKKQKGEKIFQTIWLTQITQDGRMVWRADAQVDHFDVKYLLQFILATKWIFKFDLQNPDQSKQYEQIDQQQCPSIVINTGSHGVEAGGNAYQEGVEQLFDKRIIDQTKIVIKQILQSIKQGKLTTLLTKQNVYHKIHISEISLQRPGVYPLKANHIIDTQCYGAFGMVKAKYLTHNNVKQVEKDLLFLYTPKPSAQMFWNSQIIKTLQHQTRLLKFFKFKFDLAGYSTIQQVLANVPKGKQLKVKDAKLIFRASQFNFDIAKFYQKCGSATNTLLLCITNKDKIIGGYTPLSYEWNQNDPNQQFNNQKDVASVKDKSKNSFYFSITQNAKFQMKVTTENAITRKKKNSTLCFGQSEIQICTASNANKYSQNFLCKNYWNAKYIDESAQVYRKFNGNDAVQFSTKEWQVWKLDIEG